MRENPPLINKVPDHSIPDGFADASAWVDALAGHTFPEQIRPRNVLPLETLINLKLTVATPPEVDRLFSNIEYYLSTFRYPSDDVFVQRVLGTVKPYCEGLARHIKIEPDVTPERFLDFFESANLFAHRNPNFMRRFTHIASMTFLPGPFSSSVVNHFITRREQLLEMLYDTESAYGRRRIW